MNPIRSILILFTLVGAAAQAQVAIGQWRDHFPYSRTIAVTEGPDHFFAATDFAVFSYGKDDAAIEKMSKANVLSDVGVSSLRYNTYNDVLVIGYTNGNLDLVKGNVTVNLADIKRNTTILGNKSIHHIHFRNEFAYLSTGFGIVVIDTDRDEVSDTYSIGPTLGDISVNAVATDATTIYAACDDGLYYANVNSPFLADFNVWSKRLDFVAGVSNGPFSNVVEFNGTVYVNYDHVSYNSDTMYFDSGSGWQRWDSELSLDNNGMEVTNGQLVIAHNGNVVRFDDSQNQLENVYTYNDGQSFLDCAHAIYSNDGHTYIADRQLGMVKAWNSYLAYSIIPTGPYSDKVYTMDSKGDHIWVVTGGLSGPWNQTFNIDGIFRFQEEEWTTYNAFSHPVDLPPTEQMDFLEIAVDPTDPEHAFASTWSGGVIEFENGSITNTYDELNSALQLWGTELTRVGVAGIDFDSDGNAWFSNSFCNDPIVLREADGTWHSFGASALVSGEIVGQLLVTRDNKIWILKPFVGSLGGGIQAFDHGDTYTNTSDDSYVFINGNPGTGNLPSTSLFCMAEDLDGEIWVGTSEGVAVFYTPENVFNGGNYDAQQVLIEQDGNIQILLETEEVASIAIDGANRKWFGTMGSGVFLMSEDGTEQIAHFTTENSPLISDEVTSIAINPKSGEVFFGTSLGIVSYRGTAIEGEELFSDVHAFPNPVREDYFGPIAIKGLMENSEVKITDFAGNLVFNTTSFGGQAIWDGNDLFGNRVKTGVYLVFSTDETGEYAATTKILVVGQE